METKTEKWHLWLIALAMAVLLAACSSDTDNKADQASSPETEAADQQEAGSQAADEPAADEVDEQVQPEESDKQTRTVIDEFGEVEVPVNPQRIVALYLEDYLTMLDVEPVVQWYHPKWGQQDYLQLDVPLFDYSGSVEALLAHDPDLIFVDGAADAAMYETYSKIAPTYRLQEEVLLEPDKILSTIAEVLGMADKAEQALADYEATITRTREQLQQAVGDETVAVVRLNVADKTLALFGIKNRYIGHLYTEFGLQPHHLVAEMEAFQEVLSEEGLPAIDADHLIVFPSNGSWDSPENKEAVASLNENVFWQSLPAVQSGNLYIFERTHWQSGAMKATLMKAEDLLNAFIK